MPAPMDASPPAPMASSPPPPASTAAGQEPVARPNERVRSGSRGSAGGPAGRGAANGGASHPICQLEYCRADLTSFQAYFRRHKVCKTHAMAAGTLVTGSMQRFCQQCSW